MIDAHFHLWQLDRPGHDWPTGGPLFRDHDLGEFVALAGAVGISGGVLVQSQPDDRDTDWLLEVAAAPFVRAVVGWVALDAVGAPDRLRALARHPKLRGIRPMVQDQPAGWFDDAALDLAFDTMIELGLSLDALVRPRHLAGLHRLAARRPGLAIVLDHGGKPGGDLAGWRHDIAALGALPNVWCKLSGLVTEDAPANAGTTLYEAFGNRLMWGSDWPVVTLRSEYRAWLDQARAQVPAPDVYATNAARFYRLAA